MDNESNVQKKDRRIVDWAQGQVRGWVIGTNGTEVVGGSCANRSGKK